MTRKRLTERFPFLLPLRQFQRRLFFYTGMFLDRNTYARKQSISLLREIIFKDSVLMINRNSGYDIQYQYNKVHNLKLAAEKINGLIIAPGETFSLCLAIRHADKKEPYLDGLSLVNGQIQGEYGGGLCQLSNLLYWMFLHTPLTISERHAHGSESIPPVNPDEPAGVDAAIAEGWLDLKVKNNTSHTFQICITFEKDYMTGTVRCESAKCFDYTVYNPSCRYILKNGQICRESEVARRCTSICTGTVTEELLYQDACIIGYPLPSGTRIEDESQCSTAEKNIKNIQKSI